MNTIIKSPLAILGSAIDPNAAPVVVAGLIILALIDFAKWSVQQWLERTDKKEDDL